MRLDLITLCGAVAFLAMAAVVAQAVAPSAVVSWSPPTTYTDNSELPASAIKSYTVEWRRTAGGPLVGSQTVAAPNTTATIPVACGVYVFDVTVTVDLTSAASSGVNFDSQVKCTPNPPSGLKVSKGS